MKVGKLLSLMFVSLFALPLATPHGALAAEAKPQKIQRQTTVTVLHVDKFGVYGPGIVFYWDAAMSKERISAITAVANRLRNKKATVTYLSSDEGERDKRPILVSIEAASDEPKLTGKEGAEEGDTRMAGLEEERPAPAPSLKNRGESPEESAYRREPQETALPPKPSPRPAPKQEPGRDGLEEKGKSREALTEGLTRPGGEIASASISREEVTQLVRIMLALNEKKDIDAILSYYADQVDYYGRGLVDREHIRKDMGYYFRNWDRISTSLDGDVVLIVTDEKDTRIVKFISSFSVENSKKSISGKAENIWKISKTNRGLKILDVKQKVLSSETRI